jgi:hypothetical protein
MSDPELTGQAGHRSQNIPVWRSRIGWRALAKTALWQSRCDRYCSRFVLSGGGCSGGVPVRGVLRGDVLVDVEEVAGIVGPLDLNQPVVVLPVVVPDLVVVVVLHEVDVAARL